MTFPKELLAEIAAQGAFKGFTIPEEAQDNHYEESMLAESDDGERVIFQVSVFETDQPTLALVILTTSGAAKRCGKEMLNCQPVVHVEHDDRDTTTEEYRIDLGANIISSMIQGMIDRQKEAPDELSHQLIMMMISIFFKHDDNGQLVVLDGDELELVDGGRMFANMIGTGVVQAWKVNQ